MDLPNFDTINQVAGLLASLTTVWQCISGFKKSLLVKRFFMTSRTMVETAQRKSQWFVINSVPSDFIP